MLYLVNLFVILGAAGPALGAPTLFSNQTNSVPQFVKDYAPKVWLFSQERYLPSDLDTHLGNVVAKNNFVAVQGCPDVLSSSNIRELNQMGGTNNYLTSKVDPSTYPSWLHGNAPDASGRTAGTTAAVIVVDKGDGHTIDAFYMYFYSFNWGGIVEIPVLEVGLGNFGNHVGDWEHNMIRFVDGKPTYVWYSQHANGQAFKYDVLEKDGKRPFVYSANGSHANYAVAGDHDHTIPNFNLPWEGVLTDYTNKGKLWDPLLSANFYSYNTTTQTFFTYDGLTPLSWLYFNGKWGDQQYPKNDKRQKLLFGNPKWSSGPTGPRDKKLDRKNVCPDNGNPCILRTWLQAKE